MTYEVMHPLAITFIGVAELVLWFSIVFAPLWIAGFFIAGIFGNLAKLTRT